MAPDTTMCRICLAKDVRLFTITSSMQPVFETITKTALHTPDKRPVALCCICYSHLKKCSNLMSTSAIAESVLTLLLNAHSAKIGKAISESSTLGLAKLVVSKTECYDCCFKAPVEIKIELDTRPETNHGESEAPPCPDVMDIDSDDEGEEVVTRDLDVNDDDVKGENSEDDADDRDVNDADDTDAFAELLEEGEGGKEKDVGQKETASVNDEISDHVIDGETDIITIAEPPVEKQADKEKHMEDIVATSETSEAVERKQPEDATANKTQREKGQGPHQCNICQWRFKKRTFMMRHYKTHTGEKPFECEQCHYRFADKSNLLKHLLIHTGEKPFECNVCQKRFRRKAHLTRHSKTHSNNIQDEKPFVCTFCHSRFIQEYNLTKHLRTHTGEKPYECGDCQRRFSQRSILIKHMRTHTGEKPHECNICHHRFAQKYDLKRHASKIHSKK